MQKKKTSLTPKSRNTFGPMNWYPLLGGLALGAAGLFYLSGYHPNFWLGIPCQLAAAVLIILGFPKKMAIPSEEKAVVKRPSQKLPNLSATPEQILLGGLVALAFIQVAFRTGNLDLGLVLGLGLLGAAAWFFFHLKIWDAPMAEFRIPEGKLFLALLLFSTLLRFTFVGTNVTGLQGDEANNLMDALAISQGTFDKGPFVIGWGGTPILPDFIVGFFFKLLGEKLWVGRLVSSLASLATLWFFYRWCRFWLGAVASLLATFLLSISWWFFYFSLSPFHNSILFMCQTAAFYFLEKGLRQGKRMDFCWTGIFAALCVMNYIAGRSVPLALFLTIIAIVLLRGWAFLKGVFKPLVLTALAFFWLVTPFLVFAYHNPIDIWARVDPSWISKEYHQSGSYFFLLKSYFWTLASLWTPNGSVDFRFVPPGLPFLDPFTGAFVFLGLGLLVFRLRQPSTWILIPAIFLGLSANAIARLGWPTDLAYVHSIRYSIVIPFLFLTAGWGIEWVLRAYQTFHPKGLGWAKWVLAATVAGSLALNEPLFLPRFGNERGSWGDHGFSQIYLARIISDKASTHHFLVDSGTISNAAVFLVHDKADPKPLFLDQDIPIRYQVTKNVMLIFAPWRITPVQKKKIQKTYSGAVWEEFKTPWGDSYLNTVDIPLKEVLASQKGLKPAEALP